MELLPNFLLENNFTIFDFETTGLNASQDRVIELAAIKVCNGQVVSEFSALINNGPVTPKITEITGITNEDLVCGMREEDAFNILYSYMVDESIIVAHNAAFDMGFLHHNMLRHCDRTFSNRFVDTLTISREKHFYPHKLVDMCLRYEINLEGAHRALNDVHGCWELLKKLHEEDGCERWINKLGYLNKYGAPKWTPTHAELFGTDNRYEPRESA